MVVWRRCYNTHSIMCKAAGPLQFGAPVQLSPFSTPCNFQVHQMESNIPTDSDPPPNAPLPTTRALLTSLINAISNIPLAESKPDQSRRSALSILPETNPSHTNPLHRVPPSHRHLLITLHVLFPNLILPALDLLERGSVARVLLPHCPPPPRLHNRKKNKASLNAKDDGEDANAEVSRGGPAQAAEEAGRGGEGGARADTGAGRGPAVDDEARGNDDDEDGHDDNDKHGAAGRNQAFYLVASSSSLSSSGWRRRRRREGEGEGGGEGDGERGGGGGTRGAAATIATGKRYLVRLGAWHCTCAAFAFAAAAASAAAGGWDEEGQGGVGGEAVRGDAREEWSFGGMSLDGLGQNGEEVPLCKHLLACLLAERWDAALRDYVVEWRVGREEMAGIVADV